MSEKFEDIVERITESDFRYKREAYAFVMEALSYTQKKFKSIAHVTGEEMLDGMKELLLDKYGPMTKAVLDHWGIQTTEDFGNIVFHLVESKVLSKTKDDQLENFVNRYDFDEVFIKEYRKKLHRKISRMRSM